MRECSRGWENNVQNIKINNNNNDGKKNRKKKNKVIFIFYAEAVVHEGNVEFREGKCRKGKSITLPLYSSVGHMYELYNKQEHNIIIYIYTHTRYILSSANKYYSCTRCSRIRGEVRISEKCFSCQ